MKGVTQLQTGNHRYGKPGDWRFTCPYCLSDTGGPRTWTYESWYIVVTTARNHLAEAHPNAKPPRPINPNGAALKRRRT